MKKIKRGYLCLLLAASIIYPSVTCSALVQKAKASELAKRVMIIGKQKLIVKMAMTPQEQERGLMYCRHLKDNEGMLFVFSHQKELYFWMKNTLIPLAIGFFNKNRKLVDVQEMTVLKNKNQKNIPIYGSRYPAMYALEVNKGWFTRHHVAVGAIFELHKSKMRTRPVMRRPTRR